MHTTKKHQSNKSTNEWLLLYRFCLSHTVCRVFPPPISFFVVKRISCSFNIFVQMMFFMVFFFTFISASDLLPMFHSVAVERKALLVYAFSFNSKYSCSWIPIFQLFRIYYFIFSIRSYIRHNDAVSHLSCSIRRVMHIKIIIIIHTHRTQSNWKRSESNWQHKLFLFQ